MLKRRSFLSGAPAAAVAAALAACASGARAQRPAQPIARPPGRIAGALVAGRFESSGGGGSGASPGVYAVVSVDTRADLLQLRDADGRTGSVHVNDHTFDLASLKPGDEVEVDFAVPEPGSTVLQAGGIWKVQR